MLKTFSWFEFGGSSYLHHHVVGQYYGEVLYTQEHSLSREEIHEHTVTPKFFSLMMLRELKVGAALSWMAQHRPSNSRILF